MTDSPMPPEAACLPPDERIRLFIGGIDPTGQPLPLTVDALREAVSAWEQLSAEIPEGVAALLTTSRDLFVHSWFHYEFLVVAATWSLLALEAAFRVVYPGRDGEPLKALLTRAQRDGRVDELQFDKLGAAIQLRNRLAHSTGGSVWTFGMSAGVIESVHIAIDGLFRLSPPGQQTTD